MNPVLTSFTPADVAKIFTAHGYAMVDDNRDEDSPVLRMRTRSVVTTIAFADRIPDQQLYETIAFITPDVTAPPAHSSPSIVEQQGPDSQHGPVTIGVILHFAGGVTAEWLSRRVVEWTEVIRQHHAGARKRKRALNNVTGAVH